MCALKVLVVSFSFALLTSYSVYKNLTGGLRADGCHIWKAIIALITSATATKNADSADKPSKFGWKMEKQSDRSEIKILWSSFLLLKLYTNTGLNSENEHLQKIVEQQVRTCILSWERKIESLKI